MHDLQQILIIAGLMILFFLIIVLKKYMQHALGFMLLLPCIGLVFFGYVMFSKYQLNQYYEEAFNAPEQIRYCGVFSQWLELEKSTRHGTIKEKVLVFENDVQSFVFSNSLRAQQQFPKLNELQEKDRICFQFSPRYKDDYERYILTGFEKLV